MRALFSGGVNNKIIKLLSTMRESSDDIESEKVSWNQLNMDEVNFPIDDTNHQ